MPVLTEEQSDVMLAALFLFIRMCQQAITACEGHPSQWARVSKWEHQMEVATTAHALLLDFLLG